MSLIQATILNYMNQVEQVVMKNFNKTLNCKICNKKGVIIFKKNYDDHNLIKFFETYYGIKKYKFLKNRLKHVSYSLLKCENCKFIWQKNSPKEKLSFDLYDKIIDKNESLIKSKKKFLLRKHKNRCEIDFVINQFQSSQINFLDFGAGWGHWLNSGENRKYYPYALEMSKYRQKYISKLGINIIDYKNLGKYKNFFHFIRMDQVVEHVDEFKDIFILIKKMAKKNCIFYLSVPDGGDIIKDKSKIRIEKGAVQPLEHLNCFSRYSLLKALKLEGFKKISFFEILVMHIKNLFKGGVSVSLFLRDIKDCFYSTTIKFKIR